MNKKQLYFIIFVLVIILLGVLVMPTQKTVEMPPQLDVVIAPVEVDESEAGETVNATTTETGEEIIAIEGTFLSLIEEEDRFYKGFQVMLVDDGTEILRVDLRPLLGYSKIDVIEKLGVARGQMVTVTGSVGNGEFGVHSVEGQ